jgi:hypothetical protein
VDSTTVTGLTDLLDLLLIRSRDRRVFVKETTDYSYDELLTDPRLYREVTNTFLIRRPDAVVASYRAMKPEMTKEEVGFDRLCEIFRQVRTATGNQPTVIDADDLMRDPQGIVRAYCERVGLSFMPRSMRWNSGDRPEWGQTGAWHRDASASTGFVDYRRGYAARPDNDRWLAEVADYHRPFYDEMHRARLTGTVEADAR